MFFRPNQATHEIPASLFSQGSYCDTYVKHLQMLACCFLYWFGTSKPANQFKPGKRIRCGWSSPSVKQQGCGWNVNAVPMVFSMVVHHFPTVFHHFPMVFHHFPTVFHHFPMVFPWFSYEILPSGSRCKMRSASCHFPANCRLLAPQPWTVGPLGAEWNRNIKCERNCKL